MYYVLKIYMYFERDTGGPWRCLGPTMFREWFRPPTMFSLKKWKSTDLLLFHFKKKLIYIPVLYSAGMILLNDVLNLSVTSMVGFYFMSILHWTYVLLTLPLLSFYRLGIILLYRVLVVKTVSFPVVLWLGSFCKISVHWIYHNVLSIVLY